VSLLTSAGALLSESFSEIPPHAFQLLVTLTRQDLGLFQQRAQNIDGDLDVFWSDEIVVVVGRSDVAARCRSDDELLCRLICDAETVRFDLGCLLLGFSHGN
jgi:hypothetical protein